MLMTAQKLTITFILASIFTLASIKPVLSAEKAEFKEGYSCHYAFVFDSDTDLDDNDDYVLFGNQLFSLSSYFPPLNVSSKHVLQKTLNHHYSIRAPPTPKPLFS